MPKNVQLDTVDMNILSIITKDATVSYAEMGKKLYMSPATIHARVKKMQDSGIIKGQVVTLDYERLGYDICAFLGIYLEKSSMYHSVKAELLKIPEVKN